ncbi:hypothetical protein FF011L_06290 [Roseimaritima multifibrata]|uniref:Peptidase M41 domain-containing protein n=1 Tax=Roseimaritima multifibrata TaxID=1930274 RepID=A0A517MAH6_9BACT|nr:M50 family metallopeptidase [Roseimaritima multifibrata]QDS91893.1 hypothetical protein FF011L_06290 [Roseimaritima multifibrata]
MTINRSDERFTICLHESGHGTAGIILGGRVGGILLVADGGLAHVDELSPDSHAFMVAAGPAAESLAADHEAPDTPQASYQDIATAEFPEGTDRSFVWSCGFADVEGGLRTAKSDDRSLAEWAIGGVEQYPEQWERRIKLARRVAAEIVRDHEAAIVRIAKRLFIHGRVTGDEIKQLMRGQE